MTDTINTITAKNRRILALIGFDRVSDTDMIKRLHAILSGMGGNAAFPNPPVRPAIERRSEMIHSADGILLSTPVALIGKPLVLLTSTDQIGVLSMGFFALPEVARLLVPSGRLLSRFVGFLRITCRVDGSFELSTRRGGQTARGCQYCSKCTDCE